MRSWLLLAVLWAVGCGPTESAVEVPGLDPVDTADAPLLGADGKDAAERACHVVLRTLSRVPNNTGGYTTHCVPQGSCYYVWAGALDISTQAAAEGARPYVLFKSSAGGTTWTKVSTTKTSGAPAGFTRYSFKLIKNTVPDGMSTTSLMRTRIEVAPYLYTKTGARLFDKNRGQGDFDNDVLDQGNGWTITDDAVSCQPPRPNVSTLRFLSNWTQAQHGALVAGGKGVIEYPLERLTSCRGTHNGAPAWDLLAFVRFSPGGQLVSGTVRGFDAPGGVPSNASAKAVPFEFAVPPGTQSAEVWFRNATGAGQGCEAWDSNLGQNYRYTVEPKPFAQVAWVGDVGSSLSRACTHEVGVSEPIVLDGYVRERACSFVDLDVYVPGLTDGTVSRPEGVMAEVELSLDGTPLKPAWLSFVERAGNNYRYRFQLPRDLLWYGPRWTTLGYTLRFSTDGVAWKSDVARTVTRDATWCNPAWGSCAT